MESQPQDIVASGSPAEVPNDPGYASAKCFQFLYFCDVFLYSLLFYFKI